jgi:hypothetical protein
MTISNEQVGAGFISTTEGTGDFAGSATPLSGFSKPTSSFVTGYLAENEDNAAERENGVGTWNPAANGGNGGLTRTTIYFNGLTGARHPTATKVPFTAGNKIVKFVALPVDFGTLAGQSTITESQIIDLPPVVTQAEAEAGTSTAVRRWTPERVGQAAIALAGASGGGEANTGANVATDGVGVFDGKVGVQLQFRGIATLTAGGLTVALDDTQNDIDLSLVYAAQAEAEAGTDNVKVMTALRTAQALAALGAIGAPVSASYLVLGANATLTSERVLTPQHSLSGTDQGVGAQYQVNLVNDSASPGNSQVYGTTGAGVKGWRLGPGLTIGTADPAPTDDAGAGFRNGHLRINTATPSAWILVDDSVDDAAEWVRIDNVAASSGTITSVNGDVGPTVVLDATEIDTASFTPSHYTPADVDVQSHLQGIDTLLGTLGGATSFTEVDDATDYSVTSFKVGLGGAKKNEQRRFTGNQNHLLEFVAANLADGDFGWLIRGGTGTVTLKYNNITLNGGTSDIGLLSKVKWTVHEGGVLIDGGTNEPVDMAGVIVQNVTMRDVTEATNILGNRTGALSVNYDIGHVATVTLTGNITSLTVTGLNTSAGSNWLTFIINHGTGPFTWAHPTGTKWGGGSPPTLSAGASEVSIVTYIWVGTDVYGFLGGVDFS